MPDFCHLHCHTQYSLLDGAADIDRMMAKAKGDGMKAVAITDHGNMFGAFKFYMSATKHEVKPIIGCEFYMVEDRFRKSFDRGRGERDKRYHQLLLAKNEVGYRNISKLCSLGFIDGMYGNFPRIDLELLKQYKEGIIATTCCVAAMVPGTFLEKGPEAAEKVFLEFLDIFGEDYYIEIQRHHLKGIDQDGVNVFLMQMAEKHNVKIIATNDSHYVDQEDYDAHDILLCINTGDNKSTPKGDGKGFRFGFENDQFYFKTKAEMYETYKDIPHALENTIEIVDKITTPELKRDILLPNFSLPANFANMDDYLRHLSLEGARRRYGELTSEVTERIDFELKVIKDMGFSGYFLIVQDFIAAARDLGVAVGPGRGSAAGSAVAFATGITNIDPIRYNLLFERFLNPERVSMPDIDIDFDDDGRQRVIEYVIDKYGKNQVAQIITYGTMAAKSSIRDVGRVLELPLSDTDRLAKLVPDTPGISLKAAFDEVNELKEIKAKDTLEGKTLNYAQVLEGSVRQRGIHAAGVIIAPDDLTNYIPVCTAKDSDLLVTQFDGKVIEDAGMLKMDFLGLKTLSIIRDAIELVEKRHGIKIDPDEIPLDDEKTFELYQRGETVGTFQFESEGMRLYLKQLRPTNIEDLIAMNALYRPGPMDYIPDFINRKHGREKVIYPHEWLEQILKPTYGIMVYQEQIMQTAQIIAGFSLGKADVLRRAMGKKKLSEMQKMKVEFVAGAQAKGVEKDNAEEIFSIMEKFASYGFNRSHSAAYSVVAFQTAYLKANYPAEYMAAVLTHNMTDIKKVNFFLTECNRMKTPVLGPDVNESDVKFSVNQEGQIRFALSAIKGVGTAAVEALVAEREESGHYAGLYDLVKRSNLRAVNRKCFESLAYAGAFDSFGRNRSVFFYMEPGEEQNILEKALKFGAKMQREKDSVQVSMFGDALDDAVLEPPIPEDVEPWGLLEKLTLEREYTGIYLSGHPLDNYKIEVEYLATCNTLNMDQYRNKEISIAGIVTKAEHRMTKNNTPFGRFVLEDYEGSVELALFKEDYLKNKHLIEEGQLLFIKGMNKPRWGREDQFEFRVNSMELLADVRGKYTLDMTLQLGLHDLDDSIVDELLEIVKNHPGRSELKLELIDYEDKNMVPFHSKTLKVDVNRELLEYLDSHKALQFKVKA